MTGRGQGMWCCVRMRDGERSGTRLFSEAVTEEAERIDQIFIACRWRDKDRRRDIFIQMDGGEKHLQKKTMEKRKQIKA